MSFTLPFLLGPVFFLTALPCSGGYHLERGGMPLPNAFWINFKKGATENQLADNNNNNNNFIETRLQDTIGK